MSDIRIRRADTMGTIQSTSFVPESEVILTVCKTRAEFILLTLLGDGQILLPKYILDIAKEFDVSETSLRWAKTLLGVRSIKAGFPAKVIGWGILDKVESLER